MLDRPESGPDALSCAQILPPSTAPFADVVFDIETDGLLHTVTKVHCLVARCITTGAVLRFTDPDAGVPGDGSIEDGISLLARARCLVGHNIIGYDLPTLAKLHDFIPSCSVIDTLVIARLVYPDIAPLDYQRNHNGLGLPPKLIGSHSLKAWGIRLNLHKGAYGGDEAWNQLTQAMLDYCVQDTAVTLRLFAYLNPARLPTAALDLEHDVARIIARQVAHGFVFDSAAARQLEAKLRQRQSELTAELAVLFPTWDVDDGVFIPKRDNAKRGYVAGVPVRKRKTITFNPGSHAHIVDRLVTLRGWKPDKKTLTGKTALDEEVLAALPYPEAKPLAEYLLVVKRLGQLADGKQAWLNLVRDGRIYGSVNTNGAVTGRMTHFNPNVAQTPAVRSPYGSECRSLFRAADGKVLVGCDAEALELRDLAGYMARWDGGAYIRTVLDGRKEDGTDIHSINMRALGLTSRDDAKTWFYAYIYGAGDARLGRISGGDSALGKEQRELFQRNLPALASLVAAVKQRLQSRKYLLGLDGRRLYARSPHAALNTLLQSAGALQMKRALVILDADLADLGFLPGRDYEFVANIHDEWQIETLPEIAELVGKTAADAIRKAGEFFEFPCPLKGNFSVGLTWADSH
ncbi:DNA polymerase [uncultured Hyphomicrobium sp.]|jgi:DNA polymerase-1|uniref:DNA polymerase n=1 Tax=uncultured Hyphomicrobium sp. TaxID=194373 RepID=UPI0025E3526D|nr:DNA polymerase [uncultured Hyphomicrobium sp.]